VLPASNDKAAASGIKLDYSDGPVARVAEKFMAVNGSLEPYPKQKQHLFAAPFVCMGKSWLIDG
jgi:hypothetical protein